VLSRGYEEPKKLNVWEYAASLDVVIDNINLSLLDKTMFTSGLNMTRSTMDQLTACSMLKVLEVKRLSIVEIITLNLN
jgi:hypothetical protein